MTYYVSIGDMESGTRRFQEGTLRTRYSDERNCYGVTDPGDKDYGTSLVCWPNAEKWDGKAWGPLDAGPA